MLRELELNPEYMQVIDLVAERFPLAAQAARVMFSGDFGAEVAEETWEFLRKHGFVLREAEQWVMTSAAQQLHKLGPVFSYYAVLGIVCRELEHERELSKLTEWDPSVAYGFEEFDLQAYAAGVVEASLDGHQPRP
ncbi:hypothetical protein [Corynebacterium epidermidicanis]|uniref:hypothetical protein n=1 Tax=Corynebacterium epidermidicanis TaxID=1050174 RepID=UPI000640DB01|nr:hypothetical protein [Corynebacterium epidermidicanis]